MYTDRLYRNYCATGRRGSDQQDGVKKEALRRRVLETGRGRRGNRDQTKCDRSRHLGFDGQVSNPSQTRQLNLAGALERGVVSGARLLGVVLAAVVRPDWLAAIVGRSLRRVHVRADHAQARHETPRQQER